MSKGLKFFSILFISLSASLFFTNCKIETEEHIHTFEKKWSMDETFHWHNATCGHTTVVSEKDNHAWEEGAIITAPTCIDKGKKEVHCTVCSKSKTVEIPISTEHDWDEGKITTEPDDSHQGVKTYTCKVCNLNRYEILPVVPHTHTFSELWTSNEDYHWHEATCSHFEVSERGLHVWDKGEVTKQSTEYTDGERLYRCLTCGKEKKETIARADHKHTFADTYSSNEDYHWYVATCPHTDVKDKAEHTWDDGVITKAPGCFTMGQKTYTCTVCGRTKISDTPAKGSHSYSSEWTHDDSYHWKGSTCEHPFEYTDKEEHQFDEYTFTCKCGCVREVEVGELINRLGTKVTQITADSSMPGVTLSEDRTQANVYGVKLTGYFSYRGAFDADGESVYRQGYHFPDSLVTADLTGLDIREVPDLAGMFFGCSKLESLNISNFNTSKVYIMRYMFYGCSSLTEIDLSSIDTSNVYDISHMFENCTSLKNIDLSGFITTKNKWLGCMFKNCENLESIDLSLFDTKLVYDFAEMFSGCTSLKDVNISSFTISDLENDIVESRFFNMFKDCTSLKTLDIRNFDTSNNFTDSESMFANCGSAAEPLTVTVSNKWTISTTSKRGAVNLVFIKKACEAGLITVEQFISYIGNARIITADPANPGITVIDSTVNVYGISLEGSFVDNITAKTNSVSAIHFPSSLVSADLTGLDVSMVTNLQGMFMYCSNLQNLNISNFNTSNCTDMRYMFYGCSSLSEIDVSSLDTSNATDISHMFEYCTKLTEIDISNFITDKNEWLDYFFAECSKLVSINWGTFNTSSVTSLPCMFKNCTSLKQLNLSHFNTSKVRKFWSMFSGCTGLERLDLSSFNTSKNDQNEMMFKSCGTSEAPLFVFIGDNWTFETTKTLCGAYNLSFAHHITDFTQAPVEDFLAEIGYVKTITADPSKPGITVTGTTANIYGVRLTGVFSDNQGKGTAISGVERHFPSSLESANLTGLDISGLTNIQGMFMKCSRLKQLNISNFNTSSVDCMRYLFYGCSSLTEIDLSSFDTSNATDISHMFENCSMLTEIDLSGFVTEKNEWLNGMFSGCTNLTKIKWGELNTSAVKQCREMFARCVSIETLDLSHFDTSNITSMEYMFSGCVKLGELDLSTFDTSAVKYYTAMFRSCGTAELPLVIRYNPLIWSLDTSSTLGNATALKFVGTE